MWNKREASMDAAWQAIATAGATAVVILIGALIISWTDRWRKRSGSERLSANEQLANFRKLYEKGQLSQEEFERIRALLSPQLRHELDVPAKPPGTAPEQRPETPKPAEPGSPPA